MEDVTGDWRRLHDEKIHDLYLLPNTIIVIKSKRTRWSGNLARRGGKFVRGFGGET